MPAVCAIISAKEFIAIAWAVVVLVAFPASIQAQRLRPHYVDPALAVDALADAEAADLSGDASAVDFYFEAATRAARILEHNPAALTGDSDVETLHRNALEGFIVAAQRYGRIDAQRK